MKNFEKKLANTNRELAELQRKYKNVIKNYNQCIQRQSHMMSDIIALASTIKFLAVPEETKNGIDKDSKTIHNVMNSNLLDQGEDEKETIDNKWNDWNPTKTDKPEIEFGGIDLGEVKK